MVCIEVAPGDIDFKRISECQRSADEGHYAMATAGFIRWVSGRYEQVQKALQREIVSFRDKQVVGSQAGSPPAHRRTPDNFCNLAAGLKLFLQFAREIRAVNGRTVDRLWKRSLTALDSLIAHQQQTQKSADPTRAFVLTLPALMSSGRGHLATFDGKKPEQPGAAGWRLTKGGDNWEPQGPRIGWVDGDDVFLEPRTTFTAVQQMLRESGDYLSLSLATLKRRLKQARLLASTDEPRESITVRRTTEGHQRELLHFFYSSLSLEENPTNFLTPPKGSSGVGSLVSGFSPDVGFFEGNFLTPTQSGSESSKKIRKFVGFPKSEGSDQKKKPQKGRKPLSGGASKTRQAGKKTRQSKPQKPDKRSRRPPEKQYRNALAAVDQYYPGTEESFIQRLIAENGKRGLKQSTDAELATAIHRGYRPGKQTGRGLFLSTVPQALREIRAEVALKMKQQATAKRIQQRLPEIRPDDDGPVVRSYRCKTCHILREVYKSGKETNCRCSSKAAKGQT